MTRHLGADDPPKPRRRVVGVTRTPEEKAKIAEELIRQAAEAEAEAEAIVAPKPKKPRKPRTPKATAAAVAADVAANVAAESQAAADVARIEAEAKEAEARLATAQAEAAAAVAAQAEAEAPTFYEPSEAVLQLEPPKTELRPATQLPPTRQRRQPAIREPKPRKVRENAKFIREGSRYNAPHGRLINEPPFGNYCERSVEHLSHFDPESLVWKKLNSKTWNVMGCPVDQWRPRARRCSVALRIQKIVIKPKSGKTSKPVACRVDADCPGKGHGAHVCDEGICVRAKCPPEMRRLKK